MGAMENDPQQENWLVTVIPALQHSAAWVDTQPAAFSAYLACTNSRQRLGDRQVQNPSRPAGQRSF